MSILHLLASISFVFGASHAVLVGDGRLEYAGMMLGGACYAFARSLTELQKK